MLRTQSFAVCVIAPLLMSAGCYESHLPDYAVAPDRESDRYMGPSFGPRPTVGKQLVGRAPYVRPDLPAVECTVQPTPDCVSSFPRIMIVMDASSSMLAGRSPGANNWDKARFAIAGNPDASGSAKGGAVVPAFARELEVRGNLVTIEDVIHLGMIVFNAADVQRLVLQYTPCATDNLSWAMDAYTSCDPPNCVDPYVGEPIWTFKNSNFDREPPFIEPTFSYMPPCNPGGTLSCVGTEFNTFTAEGLKFAAENLNSYRSVPGGFEFSPGTRFANILITDGATSPGSMPVSVLNMMAADGVPTYVIGLEPQGIGLDAAGALEQLDGYARAGGTGLATLIKATESDIADAFAEAVTRIIDDLGTDPCCQPNHCSDNPEPAEP